MTRRAGERRSPADAPRPPLPAAPSHWAAGRVMGGPPVRAALTPTHRHLALRLSGARSPAGLAT
ncbi:hypothetical protein E2C01_009956 [Portunus trituberculatus]|uniref:Uncharacterized protein n=1 Tax=Portunus trituberculatus TaxID=210409 RepID=A0A5B7D743_PORTR|nr:hypothetical protein [Portunus trituberculatus]